MDFIHKPSSVTGTTRLFCLALLLTGSWWPSWIIRNLATTGGAVEVIDSIGRRRTLTQLWMGGVNGLAWSLKGNKIWLSASPVGSGSNLYAIDLSGRQRIILRSGIRLVLQDISSNGEVLMTEENVRFGIVKLLSDLGQERNLSWSQLVGLFIPDRRFEPRREYHSVQRTE